MEFPAGWHIPIGSPPPPQPTSDHAEFGGLFRHYKNANTKKAEFQNDPGLHAQRFIDCWKILGYSYNRLFRMAFNHDQDVLRGKAEADALPKHLWEVLCAAKNLCKLPTITRLSHIVDRTVEHFNSRIAKGELPADEEDHDQVVTVEQTPPPPVVQNLSMEEVNREFYFFLRNQLGTVMGRPDHAAHVFQTVTNIVTGEAGIDGVSLIALYRCDSYCATAASPSRFQQLLKVILKPTSLMMLPQHFPADQLIRLLIKYCVESKYLNEPIFLTDQAKDAYNTAVAELPALSPPPPPQSQPYASPPPLCKLKRRHEDWPADRDEFSMKEKEEETITSVNKWATKAIVPSRRVSEILGQRKNKKKYWKESGKGRIWCPFALDERFVGDGPPCNWNRSYCSIGEYRHHIFQAHTKFSDPLLAMSLSSVSRVHDMLYSKERLTRTARGEILNVYREELDKRNGKKGKKKKGKKESEKRKWRAAAAAAAKVNTWTNQISGNCNLDAKQFRNQ